MDNIIKVAYIPTQTTYQMVIVSLTSLFLNNENNKIEINLIIDENYYSKSLADLKNNQNFYECKKDLFRYNNIDNMENP